jgi:hypothetical protein
VVYRYARDELDEKSPEITDDGKRAEVAGDDSGATVEHEQVAPEADART